MSGSSYNNFSSFKSKLLSKHPNLIHLFSGKQFGVNHFKQESREAVRILDISKKHWISESLFQELGVKPDVLIWPRQTHSKNVAYVHAENYLTEFSDTDALITQMKGIFIGVKTADCVPILLFDPITQSIAAVHSGWRGTIQNIIGETIDLMVANFKVAPKNLLVSVGPCIGTSNYEVGSEVADQFHLKFGNRSLQILKASANDKWFLDLKEAIQIQLHQQGVIETNIDLIDCCTYENVNHFYSARREGLTTGRMINGLMLTH